MPNKKKKIIIINLYLIVEILILAEFAAFMNFNNFKLYGSFNNYVPYFHTTTDLLKVIPDGAYYPLRYSEPETTFISKKSPILLLGCSYAFGAYISEEGSLSGQLRRNTNRWIYNFGVTGQDLTVASMLIDEEKNKSILKQKPEYIIYTYMFHHLCRIANWRYYNYYRQKGYIPNQKYNFLYKSYLYSYFQNRILENQFFNDKEYKLHQEIFFKMLKDIKTTTNQIYPESKFVALIYSDINYDLSGTIKESVKYDSNKLDTLFNIMYSDNFKEKFKNIGIEVYTTEELIGRKMYMDWDRVKDDINSPHPSEQAWKVIAPKLAERLEL